MIATDTLLVLAVCGAAIALNPDTYTLCHRLRVALRFRRNGYTWRASWRLAEGR